MKLVKCPRCDLNYIYETESLCKVCLREKKGSHDNDELDICSMCNSTPSLPGKDVCLGCLKEINNSGRDITEDETRKRKEPSISMNDASEIQEMMPTLNDDENPEDFDKLENEISLESLIEDEEEDDEFHEDVQ